MALLAPAPAWGLRASPRCDQSFASSMDPTGIVVGCLDRAGFHCPRNRSCLGARSTLLATNAWGELPLTLLIAALVAIVLLREVPGKKAAWALCAVVVAIALFGGIFLVGARASARTRQLFRVIRTAKLTEAALSRAIPARPGRSSGPCRRGDVFR